MRRSIQVAISAAVLALALGVAARRVESRQNGVFRSETRTVAIYATVVDGDHQLVTDLARDEFEVRDNGKPVTLTVFSAAPAPITIAIMLDTSGSMEDTLPRVVTATEQLIDRLRPDDAARLGAFGARTRLSPSFTSDHAALLRFLHTSVHAEGDTPLWNAVDLSMVYLQDVPGRRVVLVFTDGFDTTTMEHGFEAVTKRADAEDVMIYAVGCWGGPGSGDDRPDGSLRKIADRTGGGYTELTWTSGDLGATFTRIADELHHQYVLGFTPLRLDGKTHDISVRVTRPGLTARARKTYVATR